MQFSPSLGECKRPKNQIRHKLSSQGDTSQSDTHHKVTDKQLGISFYLLSSGVEYPHA